MCFARVQRAVLPWRYGGTNVDDRFDRDLVTFTRPRRPAVDLRLRRGLQRRTAQRHPQVPVRLDYLERQWPGAERAWDALRVKRIVHRTVAEAAEDAAV